MIDELLGWRARGYRGPNVRLIIPSTVDFSVNGREPVACTVLVHDTAVMKEIASRPTMLQLGEFFTKGKIEFVGDGLAALSLAEHLLSSTGEEDRRRNGIWGDLLFFLSAMGSKFAQRSTDLTRARAKSAIAAHYDYPPAFWELWLDSSLQYTCAYFASAEDTIDQAQKRKLRHVAQKLRLCAGMAVLDIGCGWGGLARHLGERLVHCTGVTLSRTQFDYATKKSELAGLSDRSRFILADFRDLDVPTQFDAVTAIGLQEHLGHRLTAMLFATAMKNLKPGGLFLNQAIASCRSKPLLTGPSFIDKHIFPEGDLMTIDETLAEGDRSGFEICDVENMREHYVSTLQHWREALNKRMDEVVALIGTERFRAFNLYLMMSEHGFRSGRLHVYQTVLRKPDASAAPMPIPRPQWRNSVAATAVAEDWTPA